MMYATNNKKIMLWENSQLFGLYYLISLVESYFENKAIKIQDTKTYITGQIFIDYFPGYIF